MHQLLIHFHFGPVPFTGYNFGKMTTFIIQFWLMTSL